MVKAVFLIIGLQLLGSFCVCGFLIKQLFQRVILKDTVSSHLRQFGLESHLFEKGFYIFNFIFCCNI